MSNIMTGSTPPKAEESQTRMDQTPKDTIPLLVEGPKVEADENTVNGKAAQVQTFPEMAN